ncbi:MAG TPA: TOBE domain-containing protein [Dehalococcoidia bacterium]|nr:TOBE domain-containing protein [Dehalococcoidia bacterium]
MEISARNKLPGVVKEIKSGAILAEVTISVGDNDITAIITKGSADQLDLKVGDRVYAIVKATEVMIGK